MPEAREIGRVTHFFAKPSVAIVKLDAGGLAVGDTVRFLGHTTDFTERVDSMEVDHQKVERAETGAEVAVQVKARVRRHDKVLKVTPGPPPA